MASQNLELVIMVLEEISHKYVAARFVLKYFKAAFHKINQSNLTPEQAQTSIQGCPPVLDAINSMNSSQTQDPSRDIFGEHHPAWSEAVDMSVLNEMEGDSDMLFVENSWQDIFHQF